MAKGNPMKLRLEYFACHSYIYIFIFIFLFFVVGELLESCWRVFALIKKGNADMNKSDNNGRTALMKASNWGHDVVIKNVD